MPLASCATPPKKRGRPRSRPVAVEDSPSKADGEHFAKARKLVTALSSRGVRASVEVNLTGSSTPCAPRGRRPTGTAEAEAAAATLSGIAGKQKASLERAAASLRPDGAPGMLPCREVEQRGLSKHLRAAVAKGGTAQVLYVSGMPGTGKTACVLNAVEQLRKGKGALAFELVHVNAMRLGAPTSVFSAIQSQLPRKDSRRCAAGAAQGELSAFFSARQAKDPPVVLIVDEVDHLVTRNQAVLYRLFNWLTLPHPGLVMVAISNTMDLPERLLPRVASRFGVVRVDFEPYKRDQIFQILQERLGAHNALDAFSTETLRLCAARVAAGSGDIRKALQLCKRAVDVRLNAAGRHGSGPAVIAHLQEAERELLHANPAAHHIAGLSSKARRLLAALLLELWKRDADAAPLGQVAARYSRLLELVSEPAAAGQRGAEEEAGYLAERLAACALLAQQQVRAIDAKSLPTWTLALGGGLDTEDLAEALLGAEEHEGLRELLRRQQDECRAAASKAM